MLNLDSLQTNQTAVIIGGGPGGTMCGIALRKLAREQGKSIHVILFDGKATVGEAHYNQCVGVLSPPVDEILESQGVPFPHHLVQRQIQGYILHGERRRIRLTEAGEISFATRRVEFDTYMLEQARAHGVDVRSSRVTDLEFLPNRVNVYAESSKIHADVVFGAFGLDPGTTTTLSEATPYRPPRYLVSMVTKIHPPQEIMARWENDIHAFLPKNPRIEFGAITPKGDHVTVNLAGETVTSADMTEFLRYPPVRRVLHFADPDHPVNPQQDFIFYRGRFPISVAPHFYGDRYVCIGDAAGLVRAFKGKGVTSACQTAIWAAETALTDGISRAAFARHYRHACGEILRDVPYGKVMRRLAVTGSRVGLVDTLVALAKKNDGLHHALFDAVSAHRSYRDITTDLLSVREIGLLLRDFAALGKNTIVPAK